MRVMGAGILAIFLGGSACLGQADRGIFTGIVTDNSGAVVPVVTVSVQCRGR